MFLPKSRTQEGGIGKVKKAGGQLSCSDWQTETFALSSVVCLHFTKLFRLCSLCVKGKLSALL